MSRGFRLSRRAFLRGAGAVITLPWLEAMAWSRTTASAPLRTLVFFIPNGMRMDLWHPSGGDELVLSEHLESLEPHKDDILVLAGLQNMPGFKPEGVGEPHANCVGALLTGIAVPDPGQPPPEEFISFDQVLANASVGDTAYSSMAIGTYDSSFFAQCPDDQCKYRWNLSWKGPADPFVRDLDALSVFQRLFGMMPTSLERMEQSRAEGLHGVSAETLRIRQAKYKQSILDSVIADTKWLQGRLGAADQARLDQYLTAIRELEKRMENSTANECLLGGGNDFDINSNKNDPEEGVRQMCDLITLAFMCDQTRVLTYMMGAGRSDRRFPHIGVYDSHHELTHHKEDPDKKAKLIPIEKWEISQLAYLLKKFKTVDQGEGTLLDHSQILALGAMGDGNWHTPWDMPIILAGGANGQIKTGRYLKLHDRTPFANLLISLMGNAGVHVDSFGAEGTGTLTGLNG